MSEPNDDTQSDAIEQSENYTELEIEVSESDLECLQHGSAVTYEFREDGGDGVLAVNVDSERELDKEWLLGEEEEPDVTPSQWKAIAGVALVMIGMMQATTGIVNFEPMITGGIIAVLGGIYAVDQVRGAQACSEVA